MKINVLFLVISMAWVCLLILAIWLLVSIIGW